MAAMSVPSMAFALTAIVSFTNRAAASALADIGDDRAVEPLTAMSQSHRDPEMRSRAEGWLKRLKEKKPA